MHCAPECLVGAAGSPVSASPGAGGTEPTAHLPAGTHMCAGPEGKTHYAALMETTDTVML